MGFLTTAKEVLVFAPPRGFEPTTSAFAKLRASSYTMGTED